VAEPNSRPRVLVKERIADAGVALLRERFHVDVAVEMPAEELADAIAGYDALIVRSATRVTADLIGRAPRLKVIGRAGTGVDNVDVGAATRRGIVVANAPGSNMVAAAEHAVGLLLAVARNIPQANAALRAGRWERRNGVELADKTLGVVGFGRIGQLVAARARGLEMRVIARDPVVSEARFRELQVTPVSLDELWAQADFVTLHAPLTPETRHLIDSESLACMKRGVRIVNAARGELVDLEALVEALESGHVAGAGLDVFPTEPYTEGPILGLDNVVATPHLGASTREAQDRAGVIVAEQVAAALDGELVSNAVNIPQVRAEDMEVVGPYLPLARRLGTLATGLCGRGTGIEVVYAGALAQADTRLLTNAVVEGAFLATTDEQVNLVNARTVAEAHGIRIAEERSPAIGDYTNLITVRCGGSEVAGTTLGRDARPWLVAVDGHRVEIELATHMLVVRNEDRPGMIGQVGMLFGEEGVNISNMSVSRSGPGTRAVMVLAVDTDPTAEALDRLRALGGIHSVRLVTVNGGT
jgi:D-3-phosphoglycerate dehydrogenase / 2-oxoglutarate reductase